jgi:hypothetical protein
LISSRGHLFDQTFDTAPFALANSQTEFCHLAVSAFHNRSSAAERDHRAQWYQQHLAPAGLDQRLLDLLQSS